MNDIKLTPKEIVDKHFKPKMRGYDPEDVDEFLDQVIQDYEKFNKVTRQLEEENDRLKKQVDDLTKQVAVGQSGQTVRPSAGAANMDILKRLSNLERRVFGSQMNDSQGNHF